MTTQTRRLTFADYLNEPETMERLEIIDGEVVMAASPNRYHQVASGNIYRPVFQFVSDRGLGEVLYAPMDVVVQRDPLRVRQPDLLFVSPDRAEILGDRIYGGPDLVVEILSPSNRGRYLDDKLADYAQIDVRECWVVSLALRTVEVLRQEGGVWVQVCVRGSGERVESGILPGLELAVDGIFRGIM